MDVSVCVWRGPGWGELVLFLHSFHITLGIISSYLIAEESEWKIALEVFIGQASKKSMLPSLILLVTTHGHS